MGLVLFLTLVPRYYESWSSLGIGDPFLDEVRLRIALPVRLVGLKQGASFENGDVAPA